MRIDLRPLIALFIASLIAILLLVGMASCSPGYHKRKFIKKGGKIESVHDTIKQTITVKGADGNDSLIYVSVPVNCPEMIAPPTRFEIRYKYKTLHDTLELIRHKTKIEYKYAVKQNKTVRKSHWSNPFKWAVVFGFLILCIILAFKFKK